MIPKRGSSRTMLYNIVSSRKLLTKVQIQVTVYLQVQLWSSLSHQEPPQAHPLAQVAHLGRVIVEEQGLIQPINTDTVEDTLLLLFKLWIVRHTVLRFDNRFLHQWVGLSLKHPHKSPLKPTQSKRQHFTFPLHKTYRIIMGIVLTTTIITTITTTMDSHWVAERGPESTIPHPTAPPPKILWRSATTP